MGKKSKKKKASKNKGCNIIVVRVTKKGELIKDADKV